jgi:hypothetical protein
LSAKDEKRKKNKNTGVWEYTGCFKIGEFWIQSVVRKDPVEVVNTLKKKIALPEEDTSILILFNS